MTYTINYRRVKGSPLTNDEVDDNFLNLSTNKAELSGASFTGDVSTTTKFVGSLQGNATNVTGTVGIANGGTGATTAADALTALGAQPKLNYTPYDAANPAGYITSSGTAAYVTNISSAQITSALGFTPVRQGGGTGQGTNVLYFGWGNASGNAGGLKVTVDSTDQGWLPFSSTNTSSSGTFTYSGSIVASGNITAYSDEKYKTNWRSFNADFIEKLAGVKSGIFDRIDSFETQCGVSAQSLQQVLPEAVVEGEAGLSVAYGNAALSACVALANRVLELEARLAKLEG